ncbi:hypothetical protein H6F96_19045 [Microcoleus sp. FACHB-53]|nr:hypothetical protein [Microcoleus sp. FACHB-53]MBD2130126.1 hypothetical protein [Microcoleus sp. FACHB-1]
MSKVTGCQTPDPKRTAEFKLTGMTNGIVTPSFSVSPLWLPLPSPLDEDYSLLTPNP